MKRKTPIHIFLLVLALLAAHIENVLAFSPQPADLYIDISEQKTEWIAETCAFMTTDGCAYFSAHEAQAAWLALQAVQARGASMHFKQKAAELTEKLALWQIDLKIYTSDGQTQTHEIYATVFVQNGTWRVDRIVTFDQTLIATGD